MINDTKMIIKEQKLYCNCKLFYVGENLKLDKNTFYVKFRYSKLDRCFKHYIINFFDKIITCNYFN